MTANQNAWDKAWADVQTLRPIIEAARDEAESLRHLPDSVARAFVERDVYRLMLPTDLGGAGLTPLQHFDLSLEVARIDASAAWNYSLAMSGAMAAGTMDPAFARKFYATPACSGAGSGPPQGRATETEGGYRVTGRFAWASGVHHARIVSGGCLVVADGKPKTGPQGGPVVIHVIVPIEDVKLLDAWHTMGMRGTGSTEFELEDVFVPFERVMHMFTGKPAQPHTLFKLPTSFFGFGLAAVPLGVAFTAIEALKTMALSKKLPPPRTTLAEQASAQYTVAKAYAMVEAARLGARSAFSQVWDEVCADGVASMTSRSHLRGAMVHAVDTGIEAVTMCFREAGGAAVFKSAPFERALRDVHVIGGHVVFQRAMMEDAGRVELGLKPLLGMF